MQVFALYNPSSIEKAITTLTSLGIDSKDIFIVPIQDHDMDSLTLDKKYPQGRDAFDKGFALATALSVITAGIGFDLTLGPIIWGLIGAFGGFLIGFFIGILQLRRSDKNKKNDTLPYIVIINCKEYTVEKIEKILYEKGALGVNTPLLHTNH